MTSNINYNPSFTGNTYFSPKDVENLTKYATGVALSHKSDLNIGDIGASALSQATVSGASWLWSNKGNYAEAFKNLKNSSQAMHDVYVSGGNFVNGMKAVNCASAGSQLLSLMPSAKKLSSLSQETQTLYNQFKTASELAVKSGSKDAIANAHQLLSKANAAAYAETAASATGLWAKTKNVLGITKAGNAINSFAVKSPTFGKCLNTFKAQGGTAMLVLEGATEAVTNVYPTFKQLGVKAGFKQLGKSTVKTVASVGGWVAGAALGTKIGAAIGSIIPGAGTAVGAAVGAVIGSVCSLIGGSLGSKLAKTGAEKLVGKDELVLAQERQTQQLAQQAQVDGNVLNQVVGAASERLNQEGISSDDAKIAFTSLKAVQSGDSIATKSQTPAYQQQATATQTNPFMNNVQSFTDGAMLEQFSRQYGLV